MAKQDQPDVNTVLSHKGCCPYHEAYVGFDGHVYLVAHPKGRTDENFTFGFYPYNNGKSFCLTLTDISCDGDNP